MKSKQKQQPEAIEETLISFSLLESGRVRIVIGGDLGRVEESARGLLGFAWPGVEVTGSRRVAQGWEFTGTMPTWVEVAKFRGAADGRAAAGRGRTGPRRGTRRGTTGRSIQKGREGA